MINQNPTTSLSDKRWELVHSLWRYIQRLFPWPSCLQICIEHMTEQFFQYEKKKRFISRSFFLRITSSCIIKVAADRNASTNKKKTKKKKLHQHRDLETSLLLNAIYDVFDSLQKDELDWRRLFYMFHILSFQRQTHQFQSYKIEKQKKECVSSNHTRCTLKDFLLSAFQFYTAENDGVVSDLCSTYMFISTHNNVNSNLNKTSLIETCPRKVPLIELGHMLEYLVRPDRVPFVIEIMNTFYFDQMGSMISKYNTGADMGKDTHFTLTYSIFHSLLQHLSTHLTYEQEVYPKALLRIMSKYYLLQETIRLRDEQNVLVKRNSMKLWCTKIKRRNRLHFLFTKIFLNGLQQRLKSLWFDMLVQNALQVKATLIIQKHVRRMIDLLKYKYIRSSNAVATYLQSVARCYLGKHAYQRLLVVRQEAAVTIQRNYRSIKRRKLTRIRFMTHSDQVKLCLDQMQYVQQWQSINNIFSLLQKKHRSIQSVALESEAIFKRQREREISLSIQRNLDSYRLERKIFMQELKEYYDNILHSHEKERIVEEQLRQHDIQVRLLARRRDFENQRLKKIKRDEEIKAQYELRRKNEIEVWLQRAEDQCNIYKEYCHHCLFNPLSETERSLGTSIRRRIKTRIQEILLDADSRGEKMELLEAKKLAQAYTINSMVEEERARILGLMEYNLSQMEEDYGNSLLESLDQEIIQQEVSERLASIVICRAARSWLARLSVMKKCEETFDKVFDEVNHIFFYKNKKTEEVSWVKPKIMRNSDIPIEDKWKILRDTQGFPYYYNPFTMQMSWTPPQSYSLCANQSAVYTWWKLYPTPRGPCEYFAEPNHGTNDQSCMVYCRRCWKVYRPSDDFVT